MDRNDYRIIIDRVSEERWANYLTVRPLKKILKA